MPFVQLDPDVVKDIMTMSEDARARREGASRRRVRTLHKRALTEASHAPCERVLPTRVIVRGSLKEQLKQMRDAEMR